MTIITPDNVKVIVLDVFSSGGQTFASVEALDGKPFMGGDRWPVHTPFTTVELRELQFAEDCNCTLDQRCPICNAAAALVYGDQVTE